MELGRESLRTVLFFCFREGETAGGAHRRVCSVFGEDACSIATVKRWFAEWRTGSCRITDLVRTGRPQEDNHASEIEAIFEEYPLASAHFIAETLGVDRRSVRRTLTEVMHMKHVGFRWVPHDLTDGVRKKRVDGARNLLEFLGAQGPRQRDHVITDDQSWIFVRNKPDGCWVQEDCPRPCKAKPSQGEEKVMLTVLFSRRRIWVVNFLPAGLTFTAEYMVKGVLADLEAEVLKTKPKNGLHGWWIHLDNCTSHRAALTQDYIAGLGMLSLPHPPYSPDISPSDFALFGWLKAHLKILQLSTKQELMDVITKFLMNLEESWFASVWDEWISRIKWVCDNDGEYFIK